MDIKYYAFALFIAGLLCLIAILCRVLFADVKRQQKLLDEKETKLLELYRTIESVIEDWEDQAKTAMDDLKEYENRAAQRLAAIRPPAAKPEKPAEPPKPQPREDAAEDSRMRIAGEVLARAERMIKKNAVVQPAVAQPAVAAKSTEGVVFQRLFDDTVSETPSPQPPDAKLKQARNGAIVALAAEGKAPSQIARELGITQNEVNLVIGLNGGSFVQGS